MNHDSGEVLRPEGSITMATASSFVEAGRARAAAGDLVVDLSAVTEVDSAALALLFDWLRISRAAGWRMTVRSMPATLASLADLYGVDELLSGEA
jgi:phospholipid transport system transporter-binding protein